jgi:hypothetical protein
MKITSVVGCKPKLNGEQGLRFASIVERPLTDSVCAGVVLLTPN